MNKPYLCLVACGKTEVLKYLDHSEFHEDSDKPQSNAIPGTSTKRQKSIGINAVPVFLAKPTRSRGTLCHDSHLWYEVKVLTIKCSNSIAKRAYTHYHEKGGIHSYEM